MESISIHSKTVKGKTIRRRVESVEARHSTGKSVETVYRVSKPLLSSGATISRAPAGRQSERLRQDQVPAHAQDVSLRPGASGGERHPSGRRTSLRSGVKPVQCDRVKSLRSGPQDEAVIDCDISKHVSEIKTRVDSSSDCVKTSMEHETRNTAKHRSHKGERRSKRRIRSRTQVICSSKPPISDDIGTEPSEEASNASAQTRVHQVTGEIDRKATAATGVRQDYTVDSVRLTEMELATCKRIDSLARSRQQGRGGGGRRASAMFAKYQGPTTTTSAHHREPHEVDTKSLLTKFKLEPLGGESGDLMECSGDRAGRLTYRCDEDENEVKKKKNETDEWTTVETSFESEKDQPTGANLPNSNGLFSTAIADQRESEEYSHRLNSILSPMFVDFRSESGISDDRLNRSRGDESKVLALAETLCDYNNYYRSPDDSMTISNRSDIANCKLTSWLMSDEDSYYPTRNDNRPQSSSACFNDSSDVITAKYSSSSSSSSRGSGSSSPSYYDSYSQASLDASDAASAAVTRGLETMGAISGVDVKVKNSLNDTYVTAKPLDAMSSASHASGPDGRSVQPAVMDSADAAPDRRHRRVHVAVNKTPFKGVVLSDDRAGSTKGTLQSKTKENASSDGKRRQKISRRNNGCCSPSAPQENQPHHLRPIRPATIVLDQKIPTPDTTRSVPSPISAHTNRLSRPNSPTKNISASDRARLTPPRFPSAKSSSRSEATSPSLSKNMGTGKAVTSPTKASEWRLSMRLPEQGKDLKCAPIRSVHRPAAAVDSDRLGGARLGATSPLRSCRTLEESNAQMQKVRSIPVEEKVKEISREVDDNDKEKKIPAAAEDVAKRSSTEAKYCAKTAKFCISEDICTPTNTDIARISPVSAVVRIVSAKTHVCSCKKIEVVSMKTLEKSFPRKSLKQVERFQGFVGIDLSNRVTKRSTNKTVSNQEDSRGHNSSLKSPGYVAGQEKSFPLPNPRTFLVSSEQSDPNQRQSLKFTRRKAAEVVQSSTTKRTFLAGQTCVKKIQTRYPRNFNTTGHKLRRIRSLQNTIHCLKRVHSQQLSRANLEQQQSGMSGKSNSTQDERSSPERHHSQSSPKINGGNPVATPHSDSPPEKQSGKIPPGPNILPRSPQRLSSSPVQPQQFCSTPILGSTCSRSPLFFSPIPSLPSAKLPEKAKKNRSEPVCCRSGNYSLNTSYTIPCSSPKKPPSSCLLKPLSRYTSLIDSNRQSPTRIVSDRWKKDTTKNKWVPVKPDSPTKHRSPVRADSEKRTGNNTSPTNDRNEQSSHFNAKDMTEAVDSSTAKISTDKDSTPSSFQCIFYRNHSRPADKSRLPNGQHSKIPLASCQPFHVIPAGTDVTSFRLRVHYDDIPPRSFRYSKSHRKIIENRVPACILQLPKLMLGKARFIKDKARPPSVKPFY